MESVACLIARMGAGGGGIDVGCTVHEGYEAIDVPWRGKWGVKEEGVWDWRGKKQAKYPCLMGYYEDRDQGRTLRGWLAKDPSR